MSPSRIEQRREGVRSEIIDAAWAIARTEGLGSIGMRQLGAAVGMRAPSLYEYFPGKDAIYDAMFAEGNRLLAEGYEGLPDPADVGARAVLIEATRRFLEFCNADEVRFQLLFQRSVPGWAPSEEAYDIAVANLEALGELLVRCGIDDDASRDLWTAILTGLASQQVTNDPGGDRWTKLIEPTVDMFLHAAGRST